MPPDPISHASCLTPRLDPAQDIVRRGARFALSQAFWIGLTLATPIVALVGWYFFGRDRLDVPMRGEWDRWLMLGSVAFVVLFHVVVLVLLVAEMKPVARPPQEPPT